MPALLFCFTRRTFLHIIFTLSEDVFPQQEIERWPPKISTIFTDYEEANKGLEQTSSKFDTEQEIPVEKYCCITGEPVKSNFCRYPDSEEGTMMVMSKEQMLPPLPKSAVVLPRFSNKS